MNGPFARPMVGPDGGQFVMPLDPNASAGGFNWSGMLDVFRGNPPPAARPNPGPAPFNFSIPDLEMPQVPTGGVGSGQTYRPTPNAYRQDAQVDPSLGARETYAQGRAARIGELLSQAQEQNSAINPWDRNVWMRMLAMIPGMAGAAPGTVGRVAGETINDWNNQYRDINDRNLTLALTGEDVNSEAAEAGFGRMSGEHQTREGNVDRRYQTDVSNNQLQNQAGLVNFQEAGQNARAGASLQAQLAMAAFNQRLAELGLARSFILPQPGQASLQAGGQIAGVLGPEIQQQAVQRQAQRGLESLIQSEIALGGTSRDRQINRVHARMQELVGAGVNLSKPPRGTQADPAALARYYISQGVPLDNTAVLDAFPGFAVPE